MSYSAELDLSWDKKKVIELRKRMEIYASKLGYNQEYTKLNTFTQIEQFLYTVLFRD